MYVISKKEIEFECLQNIIRITVITVVVVCFLVISTNLKIVRKIML